MTTRSNNIPRSNIQPKAPQHITPKPVPVRESIQPFRLNSSKLIPTPGSAILHTAVAIAGMCMYTYPPSLHEYMNTAAYTMLCARICLLYTDLILT